MDTNCDINMTMYAKPEKELKENGWKIFKNQEICLKPLNVCIMYVKILMFWEFGRQKPSNNN